MEHDCRALGAIHRIANDRKFFCHFTGFLEGVAASGRLERGEVEPLMAECREFVTRIKDADAFDILEDFEAELLEHEEILDMIASREERIDSGCDKSALNRFLGYCRGIVCDGVILESEAIGIVEMVRHRPELMATVGVRDIYTTCLDAIADGIVTPDESLAICGAIASVVGECYGDTGLSNVFGVAAYDEHKLNNFPEDLNGMTVVLTGAFQTVPRREFEIQLTEIGAAIGKSVSLKTDFLIVGGTASRDWIEVNRGTKIRKALELRLKGTGPRFISEWQILRLLKA